MAITLIDSLDSIGSAVDKINSISSAIGDLEFSNINGSFVNELNRYNSILTQFDDSSEQVVLARNALQVSNSGFASISYNSNTGVLTYNGLSAAEARSAITAAGAVEFTAGELNLVGGGVNGTMFNGDAITSDLYDSIDTTEVLNSQGEVILTLRTPGI